jgi:hypothetical protein
MVFSLIKREEVAHALRSSRSDPTSCRFPQIATSAGAIFNDLSTSTPTVRYAHIAVIG